MPESEAVLTRSKKTLLISKVILISIAARKKLSSCCSVSLVPQRFLLRIGAGSSYDAAYERSHLRARRMMRWCYEAGNGVRSKDWLLSLLANRLYTLRRRLIGSAAGWGTRPIAHRHFPTGRAAPGIDFVVSAWSPTGPFASGNSLRGRPADL